MLEKPSPVGSSHAYQRFTWCRDFSASGSYGLLAPCDRAVICSTKPLTSYLLTDFIKGYINKLILLLYYYYCLLSLSLWVHDYVVMACISDNDTCTISWYDRNRVSQAMVDSSIIPLYRLLELPKWKPKNHCLWLILFRSIVRYIYCNCLLVANENIHLCDREFKSSRIALWLCTCALSNNAVSIIS